MSVTPHAISDVIDRRRRARAAIVRDAPHSIRPAKPRRSHIFPPACPQAGENRSYGILNVAIATPPRGTATLFDCASPVAGLQVTVYVPAFSWTLSVDVVPLERSLTEKAQLPPTATAIKVPISLL